MPPAVVAAAVFTATGVTLSATAAACPDLGAPERTGDPAANRFCTRQDPRFARFRELGNDPKHVAAILAAMMFAPRGVQVLALSVNNCVKPLLVEGDVIATEGGPIAPGSLAMFRLRGEQMALAKIYLGAGRASDGTVSAVAFLALKPLTIKVVPAQNLTFLRGIDWIWRGASWVRADTTAR